MNVPSLFPVTCHTNNVGHATTFVAIRGAHSNGTAYIPLALAKGATTIVVEKSNALDESLHKLILEHGARIEYVADARYALARLSTDAAGRPADKLRIIGVTGTKGKTTTVYLIEHMLQTAGFKVARITGVTNRINGQELPSSLTTPQPDYLHQFFKLCLQEGVTHVVMEVAAQALSLHRVATIQFDRVVFTNFAREHFEFYSSMDDYFAAKCAIFEHTTPMTQCFVNGDDAYCATRVSHTPHLQTYGFTSANDPKSYHISTHNGIAILHNKQTFYCSTLIGQYNASNMLVACQIAQSYAISDTCIQLALDTFKPIPGRMEKHQLPNGSIGIIDYAHNPSSYEALLSTLRPLTEHLIVVFGASGSRDKGKRPLMGAIAASYADVVILTSDNPGIIDPNMIIDDISTGVAPNHVYKLIREPDRYKAIQYAYTLSKNGSFIVLLGKGTDEYQIIGTTKHHFSERTFFKEL